MSKYFGFLFARPSFLEGVARIMDFGDTLQEYNYSSDPTEADYRAIWSDWQVVGDELRQALKTLPEASSRR